MYRYFLIFLIFCSCSSSDNLLISEEEIIEVEDKEVFLCEKYVSDDLSFRSWSSSRDMDHQNAIDMAMDDARNSLSFSISSFLDDLIVDYLQDDSLEFKYFIESDQLIEYQISNCGISCESLDRDTNGMYFYCVSIEVGHLDLISNIGKKFSSIDSNYNHLEFTKFYYKNL